MSTPYCLLLPAKIVNNGRLFTIFWLTESQSYRGAVFNTNKNKTKLVLKHKIVLKLERDDTHNTGTTETKLVNCI